MMSNPFSDEVHPGLEDFIAKVADRLPGSREALRETILYGFVRATGEEFTGGGMPDYSCEAAGIGGRFNTNNGILGVADFDRTIYVRGSDSYHGCMGGPAQGVEGTLAGLGYSLDLDMWVPHSNGEDYTDPELEAMFMILHEFSMYVRRLRGQATAGLIADTPETSAPYPIRDPSKPRILAYGGKVFIPGNRDATIEIDA